jgi:hypothetical protein
MSKLGRYSADRKKIKSITGTKTVSVAECGTIFMLSDSGGSGYTITMPTVAAAGEGWWCKMIVNCAAGASLNNSGGEDITFATEDDTDFIVLQLDVNSSLVADDAADVLTIDHTATKGTYLEWICDGTNWFITGVGGNGMITKTT